MGDKEGEYVDSGILVGVGGAGVVITVGIRSSLPTTVLNRENSKKIALKDYQGKSWTKIRG